jgi:hypothetical protein
MFGTFRPPNISPDPDYGIGSWRTVDLANALMSGVSPSGQHYYTALPYDDYAHMSTDDLRNLMAYLRTLPPVKDKLPPHELTFPMTIRRLVGFWKLIYLDQSPIEHDPSRDPDWNRGHYLVEALGHRDECYIRGGAAYVDALDQPLQRRADPSIGAGDTVDRMASGAAVARYQPGRARRVAAGQRSGQFGFLVGLAPMYPGGAPGQNDPFPGLPRASSGAITAMTSSCSTMWIENSPMPQRWIGDTSASTRTSQPAV